MAILKASLVLDLLRVHAEAHTGDVALRVFLVAQQLIIKHVPTQHEEELTVVERLLQ